ncbi:hypothetical protein QVA66_03820 [Staphylococcus chromogenes]|nr:hypothetical protein [Staphylococcus chromogenes]
MTWDEITERVLALVAEYDSNFQGLGSDESAAKVAAWRLQIQRAALGLDDLQEGVRRAYSQPRKPSNPVGAVISEAREARKIRTQGQSVHQLTAGRPTGSPYGTPITRAYEHDRAGYLTCPTCAAGDGEACTENGRTKKIPHSSRLGLAYRLNNPEGKRRHAERQAHLEQHRKTYKAPWSTRTG